MNMGLSVANDSGLQRQIGNKGFFASRLGGHQLAVISGQGKQRRVQLCVVELQIAHAALCQTLRESCCVRNDLGNIGGVQAPVLRFDRMPQTVVCLMSTELCSMLKVAVGRFYELFLLWLLVL